MSENEITTMIMLIIGALIIIVCNLRVLNKLVKKNRELDEIIKALKEGRDVDQYL